MTHRHETHCDHDVKVCAHCDVAYCAKCSKEWGAPCTLNHYAYPVYSRPYWPMWSPTFVGASTTTGGVSGNTTNLASAISNALSTSTHTHSSN